MLPPYIDVSFTPIGPIGPLPPKKGEALLVHGHDGPISLYPLSVLSDHFHLEVGKLGRCYKYAVTTCGEGAL